jgi:hypothetical protein
VVFAAEGWEPREYDWLTMTHLARFLIGGVGFFLLIVIPVLFYLKRRAQTQTRIVLYILAIWILWYLPYAPIHEGSWLRARTECIGAVNYTGLWAVAVNSSQRQ